MALVKLLEDRLLLIKNMFSIPRNGPPKIGSKERIGPVQQQIQTDDPAVEAFV